MIILFIVAIAVLIYFWTTHKPAKTRKESSESLPVPITLYDCKKAERDRKEAAKKRQAAEDIEHLQENLKLLYSLLDAKKEKYQEATDDKEVEKLTKQMISLQNQIHNAESKIEKAKFIIKYGS